MFTGIPNPDKPEHWIVPPWAANASFNELVGHFLRFHPWGNENTAHLSAFYRGYLTAIDGAAPLDENAGPAHVRWRGDLRTSIERCALLYEERTAVELFASAGVGADSRTDAGQRWIAG